LNTGTKKKNMQKEIVKQAIDMFDTPEKWNSFLELSSVKDEIRNQWYQKLKTSVTKVFCEENVVNGWSFSAWNTWDFRWYLTDFGRESFCIWMSGHRIGLWVNSNVHDSQKITDLLNTDRFSLIMSALRPDEVFSGDWKLVENGNFVFESPYNLQFDPDRLGWFAGNRTEDFITQLVQKINRIRKDEILTGLLIEINKMTKK
jgi:hypothetical protein